MENMSNHKNFVYPVGLYTYCDSVCLIRATYLPKSVVSHFETPNFMKNNWKSFNKFTQVVRNSTIDGTYDKFHSWTEYGPVYKCICRPICSASKFDRTIDVGLRLYELK